jgi:hypothetical protein
MRLGALICFALALLAPSARAQDVTRSIVIHKVAKGDDLQILAAEYYGDRNKTIFIMVENHMAHPRPLKSGEKLRIPVSRTITTKPGDTFESLAAAYLGSPRRGKFLASFNGLDETETLGAGRQLLVPFSVLHTAQGSEPFTQISLAYFGNDKQADLLRDYNFLDGKTGLEKGETLMIPVPNVRLQASKIPALDSESNDRQARRQEVQERAATALPQARQAWRTGDYAGVKAALAEIDPDYLDTDQAVQVGVLLGAAHVAYDDEQLAIAAFKKVLERKPGMPLRAFDYSPKILRVWKKAGGESQ